MKKPKKDYKARWLAAEARWVKYRRDYVAKWSGRRIPQLAQKECRLEEHIYCKALTESIRHAEVVYA